MAIRKQGYHRWDGQLKTSYIRWLPILRHGVAAIYRKKHARSLFGLSSLSFFLFLAAVYVSSRPELKMLSRLVEQIRTDNLLFDSYYTNGYLIFMMIMLSLFAGADLICRDFKLNSFVMYLSRPISRIDYLMGKFSILMFYLLMFTLVPGMILILAKIIFSGQFIISWRIFMAAWLYPLLFCFFLTSLILMLSSLTNSPKLIQVVFFSLYLFSHIIAQILKKSLHNEYYALISIYENLKRFGDYIFVGGAELTTPGWLSGMVLVGITIVCCIILAIRITKVEV